MKLELPEFNSLKEKLDYLKANKTSLIAQKKAAIKLADNFSFYGPNYKAKNANKNGATVEANPTEITVKAVINTTNVIDSHNDLHLPGIWNKSIKENKLIMHVQEHKSHAFDKIISSGQDLKVTAENYNWKELGYNMEGKTQALVFTSLVKQSRNAFMFKQYLEGYVANHSVGMRYIKMDLAINSEDYPEEKAIWDKYINEVSNKEAAQKLNYFWAVKEAQVIEGSAVPIGSNSFTPTINVEAAPGTSEKEAAKNALQNKRNLMINF